TVTPCSSSTRSTRARASCITPTGRARATIASTSRPPSPAAPSTAATTPSPAPATARASASTPWATSPASPRMAIPRRERATSGGVAYDADGNTTADGSGLSFVYNAWNELAQVKQGSTVLETFQQDGLGRRVTQTAGGSTTALYYSAQWQVIEERVGGAVRVQ